MVQHSQLGRLRVSKGAEEAPLKVVIYGVEGAGKTSWAGDAPSPIFLGEPGAKALAHVARLDPPTHLAQVVEAIASLTTMDHPYKTLVVDTLDYLEPLVWQETCRLGGKRSIEDFGYGKGYTKALEVWLGLLKALDLLQSKRGMGLILTAHATVKKFMNPSGEDFERYTLKIHEKAAAFIKGWADSVFFASYDVQVVKGEGRGAMAKASQGARWLYHSRMPSHDAKNRYGLPNTRGVPKIELAFGDFAKALARPDAEILSDLRITAQGQLELVSDEVKRSKAAAAVAACVTSQELRKVLGRIAATLAEQDEADADRASAAEDSGETPPATRPAAPEPAKAATEERTPAGTVPAVAPPPIAPSPGEVAGAVSPSTKQEPTAVVPPSQKAPDAAPAKAAVPELTPPSGNPRPADDAHARLVERLGGPRWVAVADLLTDPTTDGVHDPQLSASVLEAAGDLFGRDKANADFDSRLLGDTPTNHQLRAWVFSWPAPAVKSGRGAPKLGAGK